jgi:hypothetical protein
MSLTGKTDLLKVWIYQGVLISLKDLAEVWEQPVKDLAALARRKELLAVTHKGRQYCPADFTFLPMNKVRQLSRVLSSLKPRDQLMFWLTTHGALAGRTVAEVLRGNDWERVVQLAEHWVVEYPVQPKSRKS